MRIRPKKVNRRVSDTPVRDFTRLKRVGWVLLVAAIAVSSQQLAV